jgi:hypothetical protein
MQKAVFLQQLQSPVHGGKPYPSPGELIDPAVNLLSAEVLIALLKHLHDDPPGQSKAESVGTKGAAAVKSAPLPRTAAAAVASS